MSNLIGPILSAILWISLGAWWGRDLEQSTWDTLSPWLLGISIATIALTLIGIGVRLGRK
jgi:membrane protein DedA with SNARE-associated domain